MIQKNFPPADFKKWIKRLDTKLYEPTNQLKLNKDPKVVKPTKKKTLS